MSITASFRAYAVAALAALTVLLAIPLSAHASAGHLPHVQQQPQPRRTWWARAPTRRCPRAISVKEFDWSIENPTTIGSASAGAGAGKAKFGPLTIKKLVDASSPGLMVAAGSGTALPGATIVVRNGNPGAPDAYLQYRLKTVFMTRVGVSACGR